MAKRDGYSTQRWFEPDSALEPHTRYTLLSADDRSSEFTTGATRDSSPPRGGDLIGSDVDPHSGYDSDWSVSLETVEPRGGDPTWFEVELRGSKGGDRSMFLFDGRPVLTQAGCWPNFRFGEDWELCVRGRHVDASGNAAA